MLVPAVNQATFPIATAPLELTASTLNSASSNQLRVLDPRGDDAARKRVVIKSGKVEELKARLTAHYGFDRSASASVVPTMGPLPWINTFRKNNGITCEISVMSGHKRQVLVTSSNSVRSQKVRYVQISNLYVWQSLIYFAGTTSVPVSPLAGDIQNVAEPSHNPA